MIFNDKENINMKGTVVKANDKPSKSPHGQNIGASSSKYRLLRIIFALTIDILALAIILPLFPRIIDQYRQNDDWLFKTSSCYIKSIRLRFLSDHDAHLFWHNIGQCHKIYENFRSGSGNSVHHIDTVSSEWNPRLETILIGGILGSLFSFAQFLSAPFWGWLSDRLGRKRVLLITMVGNILAGIAWISAGSIDQKAIFKYLSFSTEISPTFCFDTSRRVPRYIGTLGFAKTHPSCVGFHLTNWNALEKVFSMSAGSSVLSSISSRIRSIINYNRDTVAIDGITNIISLLLVSNFFRFFVARVLGGFSEANVQLTLSMITDLSEDNEEESKQTTNYEGSSLPRKAVKSKTSQMALIGMAFALGFSLGPPIGAFLSKHELLVFLSSEDGAVKSAWSINGAALGCVALLVFETVYIWIAVHETSKKLKRDRLTIAQPNHQTYHKLSPKYAERMALLIQLSGFIFTLTFSGLEFTMPFLLFDSLNFSNSQQATLLATIGIISALVQGGWVRTAGKKYGEWFNLSTGLIGSLLACTGFGLVPILSKGYADVNNGNWPYSLKASLALGSIGFSLAAGTVVTSFNALFSMCISHPLFVEKHGPETYGQSQGIYRSLTQLGRAIGPLGFCAIYWWYGGLISYMVGGIFIICLSVIVGVSSKIGRKLNLGFGNNELNAHTKMD